MAWLYDELDAGEAERFEAELEADPELRAEAEGLRATRAAVAHLPEADPPAALSSYLLHAAAKEAQAPVRAEADEPGPWALLVSRLRWLGARPMVATAAALVVVVGVAGALMMGGAMKSEERPLASAAVTPGPAPAPASVPAPAGVAAAEKEVRLGEVADLEAQEALGREHDRLRDARDEGGAGSAAAPAAELARGTKKSRARADWKTPPEKKPAQKLAQKPARRESKDKAKQPAEQRVDADALVARSPRARPVNAISAAGPSASGAPSSGGVVGGAAKGFAAPPAAAAGEPVPSVAESQRQQRALDQRWATGQLQALARSKDCTIVARIANDIRDRVPDVYRASVSGSATVKKCQRAVSSEYQRRVAVRARKAGGAGGKAAASPARRGRKVEAPAQNSVEAQ